MKAKEKQDDEDRKEQDDLMKKMKPHKPVKVLLNFTSIHDLLNSIDNIAVYDRLISELERTEFNEFDEEDASLKAVDKPWINELVLLPEIEE